MSSTDTQDPMGDQTYDDVGFISQKITPKRFPYQFDIIDEREYLLPFSYDAAKAWVDKKSGYAIRDVGLQRRDCYVLQMTQLDPNLYLWETGLLCGQRNIPASMGRIL